VIYNVQSRRFAQRRQRPSPRRRLAKSHALTKPNQTAPSHPHYQVDPVSATRSNQPLRPKPKLNHSASTGNYFLLHVKIEALHPKQRTPNRSETSSFHATEPNAGSSHAGQ